MQFYPAAPWRFLTWQERSRIVLWVSHILISHRDAHGGDPNLRPWTWNPDSPASRSRSEALALASRLADEAAAHPERFEALALQNSDDEVTRASGGSLGGIRATDVPFAFLDALTTLHPGEVSKIVETGLGYHILLRRSAPPHQDVEGRRVVIRYTRTVSDIDSSPSNRPHDEARALAQRVATQARDGAPFESLVAEFSESVDRGSAGDIGLWSTLAPGTKPREIEALSHLKIGEVSPPIDTMWGFQVLQRINPSSHPRYAMVAVRLRFTADVPAEDPRSRQIVRDKAFALARTLRRSASAFGDTRQRNGEGEPEQWDWGHGPLQLTEALERLRFGEIASEPVEIPLCFVVPMRLDPRLLPAEPPVGHELPTRIEPDVERLFHDGSVAVLLRGVTELVRPELPAALHLSSPEQNAFRASLESFRKELTDATTAEARAESYRLATERLHDTLSEASYSRVMDFVEREAERLALANP